MILPLGRERGTLQGNLMIKSPVEKMKILGLVNYILLRSVFQLKSFPSKLRQTFHFWRIHDCVI